LYFANISVSSETTTFQVLGVADKRSCPWLPFSAIFRRDKRHFKAIALMKSGRAEFWTASFTGAVAVFTAALAAVTLYAVSYARAQIREAHKEAQVQHLLTFVQQYESEPMVTYRKRLAAQRLKGEQEPDDLYNVLDFFETLGRLVDRGYLDESDVWDDFAYPVLILNSDAGKIIQDYQREDPGVYISFTSLVKKLAQTESEHNGALQHISTDDVTDFYRGELSVGAGVPIKLRERLPGTPEKNK
jgi:hypothetical protein